MRRTPLGGGAILALAVAVVPLFLFAVIPLAIVFGRAFGLPSDLSLAHFVSALGETSGQRALFNTAWVSASTAFCSVLLGVPLAFVLARFNLPAARTMRTLLTLPAVVPPYLMAIAWIDLANPKAGLLNRLLLELGASEPWFDCYTPIGIIFVETLCLYPLVMIATLTSLERMDASLEECARLAGASPLTALRTITLPLMMPTIVSGGGLVFLASAASFGVPYLLGTAGPRRVEFLTTAVVNHLTVGGPTELGRAMALSTALLLLSLGAAGIGELATRSERRFAIVSGKGQRPRPLNASPALRRTLTCAAWAVITVAVIVPLVTLGFVSLLEAWGAGLGPDNLGLTNYKKVIFENPNTVPAFGRSFLLAIVASALAVGVGSLVAYFRRRSPGAMTRGLEALANAPYAVPGTVLALGLLIGWSREVRFVLFDSIVLAIDLFGGIGALLVAYSVKYLAFGVRLATNGLLQIDRSLEEAARTSGASQTRAGLDIVAPLLIPSLAAAGLLVFLPALSEITMSILLVGPGSQVVGTVLFELQSYADPPSAAVLATLLVLVTLVGNSLLRRLTGGKGGF